MWHGRLARADDANTGGSPVPRMCSFKDEAMTTMRSIWATVILAAVVAGCSSTPQYGPERQVALPGTKRQIWAIAPAVNLSGQRVDPLLQADLAFQQLQQVDGITVIPVNRVAEVYAGLRIEQVTSAEQAEIVCEMLG